MFKKTCLCIAIVLMITISLAYGDDRRTILTAERTNEKIQVDGYTNENSWGMAKSLVVKIQDGSIGSVDVSLKSLYDSEYIYFFVNWVDSTESTSKDMWSFDGGKWTFSGDEDRFAVIWNIDDSISGFNIGGCAMLCHGDRMHTNAPGEKGDLWHWKASRTNPVNYADDEWIDNSVIAGYEVKAKEAGFHSDSASDDASGYVKNINDDGTAPRFAKPEDIQRDIINPLFKGDIGSGLAVSLNGLQLKEGTKVPGYFLSRPNGSRGDIDAVGTWRNGVWNLEIQRPLNTDNVDDVQFDVTKTYRFGIAVMDDTGGFEAFGKGHSFDLGARTLEFGGVGSEEVTQLSLVRDYVLTAKIHVEQGDRGLAISELDKALSLYNEIRDTIAAKDPEQYLKSKNSFVQSKRNPTPINLQELTVDIDNIMLTLQGKRIPPEVPWNVKLLVLWGRIQLYAFVFLAVLVLYPIYRTLKIGARPQLRYMSLFILVVTIPVLLEGIGRLGVLLRIPLLQAFSFTTSEYITLLWSIGMFVALLIARYAFLEIDNTIGELEYKSGELENRVKEIQMLKDFNENIIINAPVGVLTTDASGRITSVNPRGLKMLGLKNKETTLGHDITSIFLVKRMGWDKQLKLALRGKSFVFLDEKYSLSPDKVIYASIHCAPLHDEMKGIDGLLLLLEDNTERKLLEEKFAQTEKLAATGKLAATIAHEINNPLTGIINCINLVMDDTEKGDPNRKYLEMADEELNRISRIVRRLLDSYRPSPDQMAPASVNEVLEEILELMKTQLTSKNISVRKDLESNLPQVLASREQLKEVFLNVLINAQEALPNGGNIFVDNNVNEDGITIRIRDTGVGIPEENIKRIFDPFFTTKKDGKGTGLGLSVSYGIVQAHKGTISVSSIENEGTTVMITLPIYLEGIKVV